MALTFRYRARTPNGDEVSGTVVAGDRKNAFAGLRERMLVPSHLTVLPPRPLRRILRRARPQERLAFFRSYAALEQAGIDFSTAFGLLIDQAQLPRFRDALTGIRAEVERGGEKLSVAMSHRPDEFSALEIAMVAAGEEAGNRERIFERLAALLERDERLRKQLNAALLYPAFVAAAAAVVSGYLLFAVLPQFAGIYAGFGIAQPGAVRGLLWVVAALGNPFAAGVCFATLAGFVLVTLFWIDSPGGALLCHEAASRIPIFGQILRKAAVARVARILATLLQAGVNQLRALEVAIPVAVQPAFSNAIELARERIETGKSTGLEDALGASGAFPRLLLAFVRTGSQCGNVPQMLLKVAEYYEEDVETAMTAIPALVQTALTAALGCVVGSIVYMVYVPLSTLSSGIH